MNFLADILASLFQNFRIMFCSDPYFEKLCPCCHAVTFILWQHCELENVKLLSHCILNTNTPFLFFLLSFLLLL